MPALKSWVSSSNHWFCGDKLWHLWNFPILPWASVGHFFHASFTSPCLLSFFPSSQCSFSFRLRNPLCGWEDVTVLPPQPAPAQPPSARRAKQDSKLEPAAAAAALSPVAEVPQARGACWRPHGAHLPHELSPVGTGRGGSEGVPCRGWRQRGCPRGLRPGAARPGGGREGGERRFPGRGGAYLSPQRLAVLPRLAVEALGAAQPALRPLQLPAAGGQVRLQRRHPLPQSPLLAAGRGSHACLLACLPARPLLSAHPPAATRRLGQSGGRGPARWPRPWRPAGGEGSSGEGARARATSARFSRRRRCSRKSFPAARGGNPAQPGRHQEKPEVTGRGGCECACAWEPACGCQATRWGGRGPGPLKPAAGGKLCGGGVVNLHLGAREAASERSWGVTRNPQREPGC